MSELNRTIHRKQRKDENRDNKTVFVLNHVTDSAVRSDLRSASLGQLQFIRGGGYVASLSSAT